MRKREGYQNQVELLQGTLDMLILQTLRWGPQHGYGIGQAIRSGSGEVLKVETGSLYPALHRLEKAGLITGSWQMLPNGRQRRYYHITAKGQAAYQPLIQHHA